MTILITSPSSSSSGTEILYGPILDRPAADSVDAGTQYVAVDIGLSYWSDGTSWFLLPANGDLLEDVTITYSGENVNTVVSASRTLQFTYDSNDNLLTLTNVTEGWTKTFGYVGDDLVSVTIS